MDRSEGAIYVPPKDGLPFLVVTFDGSEIKTEKTTTRSEARALLSRRTRDAKPGPAPEAAAT
jgi:hypothetical protein